ATGATASLTNTYWKLSEMNGKKVETPDNQKEVHIKFAIKENNFQGFGGCNGLGGSYELTGKDGIKIRTLSTQMYCDRMEVENFLKNAVTKADRYEINGEKLNLYEGKTLLISFDSVYF
ncbi:MAG: META domain-containing protein, partial [Chitinophagaceae bacterium]